MHLRIGGMEKEKVLLNKKTGKNGSLMDVIRGLRCISKFGECEPTVGLLPTGHEVPDLSQRLFLMPCASHSTDSLQVREAGHTTQAGEPVS